MQAQALALAPVLEQGPVLLEARRGLARWMEQAPQVVPARALAAAKTPRLQAQPAPVLEPSPPAPCRSQASYQAKLR